MASDPAATVRDLEEEGVIRLFAGQEIAASLPSDPAVVLDNGDDAAAWRFDAGVASVATTDSLVEGQHFDLAYTPADAVGRKLMAVNLSDLAAMGARPRYALISVCLPADMPASVVAAIASGVHGHCRTYGVRVLGGNTTGIRGPAVLTVTLVGEAAPSVLMRRVGARPGAAIYVTGTLGDAAAGLQQALRAGLSRPAEGTEPLFRALADPTPRVEAGVELARSGKIFSMCDVSDGLGRDLRRLVAPAGLGARIEVGRIPISSVLEAASVTLGRPPELWAMAGGEDYELLFTASSEDEAEIREICASAGTPVARIGEVTSETAVRAVYPDGRSIDVPTGFEHFPPAVQSSRR